MLQKPVMPLFLNCESVAINTTSKTSSLPFIISRNMNIHMGFGGNGETWARDPFHLEFHFVRKERKLKL